MEPFYLSPEEFWEWFNRDISKDPQLTAPVPQLYGQTGANPRPVSRGPSRSLDSMDSCDRAPTHTKKIKTIETKVRHIMETEAADRCSKRFIVMYGKHRPGKKNKVWEGDGYLSLVNGMAHLCDLKGRMIEEPKLLDDVDLKMIEDEDDILIGNTEVQIIEADRNL